MQEILKLKKPVMIDGEEKTEIAYDLDNLTGADVQRVTKELQLQENYIPTVPEIDQNYNAALFAVAAGIAREDVKRFSLKDYAEAAGKVRAFFLADAEEQLEQNI